MSRRKFNDKDGHESIYRMFNAGLEPMLEQKTKKKEQQKSFRRAAFSKIGKNIYKSKNNVP